jgi:peptidoglycan/LPS O-acetylase OafA/YrhL
MFTYIVLHILFGFVSGAAFVCLKNAQHLTRMKAWLCYLVGISICISTAAIIGELSKQGQGEELYKWIGALSVLLSFFATILIGAKLTTCKK